MANRFELGINAIMSRWGWTLAVGMAGAAAMTGASQIIMLLAFVVLFVCGVIIDIENDTVKFAKTKLGGVIPTKRRKDAGYDIYACFDEDYIAIAPGETKMIDTGICSSFSSKYVAVLKERGSTGTKGIGQRSGE